MTTRLALGLMLALAAAGALNWGFFAQHRAAAAIPPLSVRRPFRSLWLLFSNPGWLAGYVVGIGGWGLYIIALAFAPLSLVQATAAGGVGMLALLVRFVGGVGLTRREWAGVGLALVGLVFLGMSLIRPIGPETTGPAIAVAIWVTASAAAAAMAAGPAARALVPGAGLGVAAGVMYAAGDVATKVVMTGHGRTAFVPVLLACHGLGFVAMQAGFQEGGALATAGVATLFNNALPIVAGVWLFHDPFPGGALGALRVAAFGSVVIGAVLLVRADRNAGALHREAEAGPSAQRSDIERPGRRRRMA